MTHQEITPPPAYDIMKAPAYSCPELKRNPGIPDSRFAAFDLPSVRGGWRIWPDGRKEPL